MYIYTDTHRHMYTSGVSCFFPNSVYAWGSNLLQRRCTLFLARNFGAVVRLPGRLPDEVDLDEVDLDENQSPSNLNCDFDENDEISNGTERTPEVVPHPAFLQKV